MTRPAAKAFAVALQSSWTDFLVYWTAGGCLTFSFVNFCHPIEFTRGRFQCHLLPTDHSAAATSAGNALKLTWPASGHHLHCSLATLAPLVTNRYYGLTRAPLGGGGRNGPLTLFPKISTKLKQRFHTLCQKIRFRVIIGQLWVTSEWRHVPPISTKNKGFRESPPQVQF